MHAVILQGSPRKQGYTAGVAAVMTEQLQQNGYAVDNVYMHSQKISGCLACEKCKQFSDIPACIQQDDAFILFDKMMKADLILYASSLYFWGFSAQLKALIDRTYALYTGAHTPEHASLLAGKKLAVVLVGADAPEKNADYLLAAFMRYHVYLKTADAGSIYFAVGYPGYPARLDDSTVSRAQEFALSLVT